jgi:hypothetical protein
MMTGPKIIPALKEPDYKPTVVADPEIAMIKAILRMPLPADFGGPVPAADIVLMRAAVKMSAKAKAEDVILAAAAKLVVPAEAAALAIAAHPEWSNRKIAKAVGVDKKTIARARNRTVNNLTVEALSRSL